MQRAGIYRGLMTDKRHDDDITTGKRGGTGDDLTGDAGGGAATKPDFAERDMERSEAPIDQMGRDPKAGSEQNPPLPDWGPTDGEHGTDNDPELSQD